MNECDDLVLTLRFGQIDTARYKHGSLTQRRRMMKTPVVIVSMTCRFSLECQQGSNRRGMINRSYDPS